MMNMDFVKFSLGIKTKFKMMSSHPLYEVDVDAQKLWDTYLDSFENDPIFIKNREHDCSACCAFIKKAGKIVAIINNKMVSIWDFEIPNEPEYDKVAKNLAALVHSSKIKGPFYHYESSIGQDKSLAAFDNKPISFNHISFNLPPSCFLDKKAIATKIGDVITDTDMFKRSLEMMSLDALNNVIDLINQNSIYKGREFLEVVKEFKKAKIEYDSLDDSAKDLFLWISRPVTVTRFKNLVIGTLVEDLSNNVDLEDAVRMFESKVAPQNYKRSSALITKGMIEQAKKTLEESGLISSLQRRYATIDDITINDVIFADRSIKPKLSGSMLDDLAPTKSASVKNFDKIEEIDVKDFLEKIIPTATSIELFMKPNFVNNLFTLIAPADPTSPSIFKWDNKFSWCYKGNVTDSIEERVKKAGGNVDGDVCFRLAWFNFDDLDLHMMEPDGNKISFCNKINRNKNGMLDVDMNAGRGTTREAVENIFYKDIKKMREGKYKLFVNNFSKRELIDVGFTVEAAIKGQITTFNYGHPVRNHENVTVVEFNYSTDKGIEITKSLPAVTLSKEIWGIKTQEFVKVTSIMNSPNHWAGEKGIGNKHLFFVLENARSDEDSTGFYNEFLKEDLNKHRKVFEVLAAKNKISGNVADQLSGVGFSDTKRAQLICKVQGLGSIQRTVKVNI